MLIGITFKGDVADTRESAALKVAESLQKRGAILSYHDPFVPTVDINGCTLESVPLSAEEVHGSDLVAITANHSDVDYSVIARNSRLVFDTHNALKGFESPHIFRLGAPRDD